MALATVVQTRSVEPSLKPVIGVADGGITLRQERDGRFRLSSGARFENRGTIEVQGRPVAKTSIQDVNQVLAASLEICPELDQLPMESFWGGLIDMTPDGLPFLGEVSNAQGVFIGAGFSGHGFGIAPASAHILSTLMTGQSPGLHYAPFAVERFEGQTNPTEGATGATLHG